MVTTSNDILNKYGIPSNFITNKSLNLLSSGEVWLKHGHILNLSVSCDGSGPWEHCWFIKQNYTPFNNETCDGRDNKVISRGKCSFIVTRYIAKNGAYSLVIIVDDGLEHRVKQIGINVYKGPR